MPTARLDAIADAALALLAERGMRGLTHRAVDEAAGLPQGSTSNHARTRAALLELALTRLAAREVQAAPTDDLPPPPTDPDTVAAFLARALHHAMTTGRDLTRARLELALEATRNPRLRDLYDTLSRIFRTPLAHLLTTLGAPDPDRQSLSLTAWCDGILFSATTGASASSPPTEPELRASLGELLRGMLAAGG
jgi:DNA-binding transcriptional regulator YbjK